MLAGDWSDTVCARLEAVLSPEPENVRKYWHVIGIGIQNTLVYRANFLFRASFGLIPLMATLYLWRAVFRGNGGGEVSGYSLAAMTSYYLAVTVVDALTAVTDDDWQIAADIREGAMSQLLLKPIDYMVYRFCLYGATRLIYASVALVPVGIFLMVQRGSLVFPSNLWTWSAFGLSVVLTALLQFLISYSMALLSFWVLEVSTFIFILFAFEYAAGGHLFPLDILPRGLAEVLNYTPFPYQLYFPVSVFLGRVQGAELLRGILVQGAWVLLAFLVARAVWARGIRKYAAYGG